MCKYLLLIDILHVWDYLAHMIKYHRSACLSLSQYGLLKDVTYIILLLNEQELCIDVRDDILE